MVLSGRVPPRRSLQTKVCLLRIRHHCQFAPRVRQALFLLVFLQNCAERVVQGETAMSDLVGHLRPKTMKGQYAIT